MKIHKNTQGIAGGKAMLFAVIAIAIIALLYLSGLISITLPTADDEYSQTVIRGATDVGLKVPIKITLTFSQDADTSIKKTDVSCIVKHKHDDKTSSDANYVPDPEVITVSNFNTKVGNVGDTTTIWSTNGDSYQCSNITYNSTLTSLSSVLMGNSQDNYKVWTTSTMHTPSLSRDNSGIVIQTKWDHYQKGTDTLLDSDVVNFNIYYRMPSYNADDSYTQTYTFNVYVPFSTYGVVEDIYWEVLGYSEECIIEWTTVTSVTHTWWDFPVLNWFFPGANLQLACTQEVSLPTAISYTWTGPFSIGIDNDDTYGSHRYLYKVR